MNDIVVALGGGGMKGYAHIGVLRQLEREGFRIRGIAGTSAGGMIGAVYAAGYDPDEIERSLLAIDHNHLYRRLPEDGPSMLGLSGVVAALSESLANCYFKELRLPFAVTAVDLDAAQLVALRGGNVLEAVLATIAVPGVFPARIWHGRTLIDGGVLDPVPVRLARTLAPDYPVVAIVLSPPAAEWHSPTPPRLLNSLPFLTTYLARLRVARALNIFLRSVDIGGLQLTELRLQLDQPEVVIRPKVPHIGLLDTVDARAVIQLGEQAVKASLSELREAVGWRAYIKRKVVKRYLPVFLEEDILTQDGDQSAPADTQPVALADISPTGAPGSISSNGEKPELANSDVQAGPDVNLDSQTRGLPIRNIGNWINGAWRPRSDSNQAPDRRIEEDDT